MVSCIIICPVTFCLYQIHSLTGFETQSSPSHCHRKETRRPNVDHRFDSDRTEQVRRSGGHRVGLGFPEVFLNNSFTDVVGINFDLGKCTKVYDARFLKTFEKLNKGVKRIRC